MKEETRFGKKKVIRKDKENKRLRGGNIKSLEMDNFRSAER